MSKIQKNKKELFAKRVAIFLLALMPILIILSFVNPLSKYILGFMGYAFYAYVSIFILIAFNILFWKRKIKLYRALIFAFFSFFLISLTHVLVLGKDGYVNLDPSIISGNVSVGGYVFSLIIKLLNEIQYNKIIALLLSCSGLTLLALAFPGVKAIDKYFLNKKDSKLQKQTPKQDNLDDFIESSSEKEEINESLEKPEEKPLTAMELLFENLPVEEASGTFAGLINVDEEKSIYSAKLLFEEDHPQLLRGADQTNYRIIDKEWDTFEKMYDKWQGNDILTQRPIEEVTESNDLDLGRPTYPFESNSKEKAPFSDTSISNKDDNLQREKSFFESEQMTIEQANDIGERIVSSGSNAEEVLPNLTNLRREEFTPTYNKSETENHYQQDEPKKSNNMPQESKYLTTETKIDKSRVKEEPYSAQISIDTLNIGEKTREIPEQKEKTSQINVPTTQTSFFDNKYKDDKTLSQIRAGSNPYVPPQVDFLKTYPGNNVTFPTDYYELKQKIETTMAEFDVPAEVIGAMRGPTFTLYELKLGPGYQISRIKSLKENLKMRLEVAQLRILAPIEGKDAFGLEVPNKERDIVGLKTLVEDQEFMKGKDGIKICLGKTLQGQNFYGDLADMPHLLVAGATGTGKSVFLNSVIVSILYKYSPSQVKLILIDPKRVELSVYKGLPNLLIAETVKESSQAVNTLKWLTEEMDRRYKFFEDVGCANINQYNNFIRDPNKDPLMYRIVLVIDEMSDLMMKGKGEVESYVVRISQLARACGIHLIIATQRPVVRVITGMIKSNIIYRVAFQVKSNTDSRVVLDDGGAEDLLGKGDMLYSSSSGTVRLQGALIEIDEIKKVCDYLRANNESFYNEDLYNAINAKPAEMQENQTSTAESKDDKTNEDFEALLAKVLLYFIRMGKASISSAQSAFGIGFMRGRRIVDALEARGYLGAATPGTQGREVLITEDEYQLEFEDQ